MTEADPTRELLERWNDGDGGALDELLARNLPWIRRHVHGRLGQGLRRKADTEDFVQDAVLEMLRYGPHFVVESQARFRALLAKIAENVLRGRHDWFHAQRRAMSRERALQTASVLQLHPPVASQTSPSEAVARREQEDWIRLGLEFLRPEDREIVLLREWEDLPFDAIGARVGISSEAARGRFHRALGRLAKTAKMLRNGQLGEVLEAEGAQE